ncbi:anaerobic glycerol-3-phosphate dehydrogenase subunit GlpA [Desulfovibrio mangrovi]|uniref:anaerobic glycerol-3-phosphate dehydrogenase subunit GlpA n=1 Tax=Desulfovibrio mangrovi TaxID=2976983 RepID=UPI00224657C2|nr:anaerobic glycerol-3-phosphate dehydrogenase subunit GlpA [Desulfovibrio mangrovi]UZP68545.1 anaerobic glycerol-3-phosphate dehydrogenase subunit GlpA [Desulfovibrio mangrovi]
MKTLSTTVLIIGGGATGTGLARDLSLRGIRCLLVEKRDINSGASGANHGLLHSGARYVASDSEAAIECREEGEILKRLAPQCIDDTGGLFVAVPGDSEQYIADFESMCARSAIPCSPISTVEARELEPSLSDRIIAAYSVEDAAVDPFMLSLDNLAHAVSLGSEFRCNARVTNLHISNGGIERVTLHDDTTGEDFQVEAELVVNAAGAWAGNIAAMAGARINLLYSSGSLLITQNRLTTRVINRLRKPADSDILVPGGTVSVLGTTSVTIDDPDKSRPTVEEADRIIDDARAMMPILETTRYIRAYAGVRPLVLAGDSSDARNVSRGFSLIDHERDNIGNFVTITGGKLTTYRLMAEKTADLVCAKLGINARCATREVPLPASTMGRWTEPGLTAKTWLGTRDVHDQILCECEMVSRSVIDNIIDTIGSEGPNRGDSMLTAIGLRSRVGKGPCQGGFCGLRVTSHLYDRGCVQSDQGVAELKNFIERRWRGFSPILWGLPAMQADLQEALYCGMMDMELCGQRPDADALGADSMQEISALGGRE